ncbi:MAG: hypothetical protein U1F30_06365 [Steroidobacteraceae bacterium]
MTEPVADGVTVWLPDAGSLPDQPPLAVQVEPDAADHVSVADCPSTTLAGLTVIVMAGGGLEELPPPPPPPPPHALSSRLAAQAAAIAAADRNTDLVRNNMSDPP